MIDHFAIAISVLILSLNKFNDFDLRILSGNLFQTCGPVNPTKNSDTLEDEMAGLRVSIFLEVTFLLK